MAHGYRKLGEVLRLVKVSSDSGRLLLHFLPIDLAFIIPLSTEITLW